MTDAKRPAPHFLWVWVSFARRTLEARYLGEEEMTVTRERLNQIKKLLEYDPISGRIFWKVSLGSRAVKGAEAGWSRADGYRQVRCDGQIYYSHRLAWWFVHGEIPSLIDHINRDPSDNRIVNLRIADRRINALNTGLSSRNTSGIKGVCWSDDRKKWRAAHSGHKPEYFSEVCDAAIAYKRMVVEHA